MIGVFIHDKKGVKSTANMLGTIFNFFPGGHGHLQEEKAAELRAQATLRSKKRFMTTSFTIVCAFHSTAFDVQWFKIMKHIEVYIIPAFTWKLRHFLET